MYIIPANSPKEAKRSQQKCGHQEPTMAVLSPLGPGTQEVGLVQPADARAG